MYVNLPSQALVSKMTRIQRHLLQGRAGLHGVCCGLKLSPVPLCQYLLPKGVQPPPSPSPPASQAGAVSTAPTLVWGRRRGARCEYPGSSSLAAALGVCRGLMTRLCVQVGAHTISHNPTHRCLSAERPTNIHNVQQSSQSFCIISCTLLIMTFLLDHMVGGAKSCLFIIYL